MDFKMGGKTTTTGEMFSDFRQCTQYDTMMIMLILVGCCFLFWWCDVVTLSLFPHFHIVKLLENFTSHYDFF